MALAQSQKMESVGQLAGGVAHDFNNILTAIVNHSYILKKRFENDKAVTENVDKILLLSQNAAKITQELLIFSRKQPLETAPLNLNDFIIGTIKLLTAESFHGLLNKKRGMGHIRPYSAW